VSAATMIDVRSPATDRGAASVPILKTELLSVRFGGLAALSTVNFEVARDEVRAGKVKLIEISDVELWRELGLVYRRDRTLARSAAAFVSMVRNGFGGDSDHAHPAHPANAARKHKGAK